MTVAILSSSIQEKNVKRRLMVTDVLRLAATVITKNMFHLLLFLFDVEFCELSTEELRKLRADVKHVQ